jgi:hypothetical protein
MEGQRFWHFQSLRLRKGLQLSLETVKVITLRDLGVQCWRPAISNNKKKLSSGMQAHQTLSLASQPLAQHVLLAQLLRPRLSEEVREDGLTGKRLTLGALEFRRKLRMSQILGS